MGNIKRNDPVRVYAVFLIGYLIQISYLPEQYPFMKLGFFSLYGIGYLLGAARLLQQRWSRRSVVCAIIMFGIAVLVFFLNGNIGMEARFVILNLVWLLLCLRDASLDELIRADLTIRIPFTLLLFFMCKTGLLTNVVALRNYSVQRFAWGYGHPNTSGSVLFLIALYLMYLRRDKLSFGDLFLQLILAGITLKIFNSRTSVAGIVLAMMFTCYCIITRRLLRQKNRKRIRQLRIMFSFAPVIVLILMFSLSMLYDPEDKAMQFLNKLLTSRLEQGEKILDYYHPTLFGNNVVRLSWKDALEAGVNTAIVGSDILLMYIYTTFGIASLLLFVFVLVKNMSYSLKQGFCLTYCMLTMLAVSCVENQYVNIGSNVFLACFSSYVYATAKKKYTVYSSDFRATGDG